MQPGIRVLPINDHSLFKFAGGDELVELVIGLIVSSQKRLSGLVVEFQSQLQIDILFQSHYFLA